MRPLQSDLIPAAMPLTSGGQDLFKLIHLCWHLVALEGTGSITQVGETHATGMPACLF